MIGRIYKIYSNETSKVYIGSTKQPISVRLSKHRHDYHRFTNLSKYHYVSSFELMKYPDAKIELLEEIEYDTKKQLYKLESEYILKNDCVNLCSPIKSVKSC